MATKRTPIGRPPRDRITPEIIKLYGRIRDTDDSVDTRKERVILHSKMGREIWEYSIWVVDPDAESPPDWVIRNGEYRVKDWTAARDLLRALEAAVDEAK